MNKQGHLQERKPKQRPLLSPIPKMYWHRLINPNFHCIEYRMSGLAATGEIIHCAYGVTEMEPRQYVAVGVRGLRQAFRAYKKQKEAEIANADTN